MIRGFKRYYPRHTEREVQDGATASGNSLVVLITHSLTLRGRMAVQVIVLYFKKILRSLPADKNAIRKHSCAICKAPLAC